MPKDFDEYLKKAKEERMSGGRKEKLKDDEAEVEDDLENDEDSEDSEDEGDEGEDNDDE
jgi:hypothetical protein